MKQCSGYIDWPALSSCERLNWSFEIIQRFLDKLSLHSLYHSGAIRFDLKLLKLLSTHPDFLNETPVTRRIWNEVFYDMGDGEINEILGVVR